MRLNCGPARRLRLSCDVAPERRADREHADPDHPRRDQRHRGVERQQLETVGIDAGEGAAGQEPRDAREQDRERRLGDGEPAERDDERDELVAREQADADTERGVGRARDHAAGERLEDVDAPRSERVVVGCRPGQHDRELERGGEHRDQQAEREIGRDLRHDHTVPDGCGEEGRDRGAVAELAGGADGAERDKQEREVAPGAHRVPRRFRDGEVRVRVAERERGVDRRHHEDRGEQPVSHGHRRCLERLAAKLSPGHAGSFMVSSKNASSRLVVVSSCRAQCARTRPAAMITTSSTVCATSDSRWLEIRTLLPPRT